MIHSILIIGQSNMAGRGYASEVEPIRGGDLLMLRNGRGLKMFTPVNPDRVTSGVNLAESFIQRYAEDHGVRVGIIPCADGGTCLDQWQVGSLLFDHACYMAELAQRTSTIAAVLWHQGEGDTSDERCPLYEQKLTVIFEAFRKKLGLHDVPFIVGGLGEFLKDYPADHVSRNYVRVNEALKHMAETQPMIGYASSEGLTANPDNLHFSAAALREFGLRYYEEFLKLEDKNKVFEEKAHPDNAIRTWMELL